MLPRTVSASSLAPGGQCGCRPLYAWACGTLSTITFAAGRTGDKMLTLVRFRAGRRRLHRRRRCAARWWDGRCSRLRGQGATFLRSRWGHGQLDP